jgi:hypothetical protein
MVRWLRFPCLPLLSDCTYSHIYIHGVLEARGDPSFCARQAPRHLTCHKTGDCMCSSSSSRLSQSPIPYRCTRSSDHKSPRSNQERSAILLLPYRHIPAPTQLPSNIPHREMQLAMFILHARRGSTSIPSRRTPHHSRNLSSVLHLCLSRCDEDPLDRWRANCSTGYTSLDASDRISSLPRPARALSND